MRRYCKRRRGESPCLNRKKRLRMQCASVSRCWPPAMPRTGRWSGRRWPAWSPAARRPSPRRRCRRRLLLAVDAVQAVAGRIVDVPDIDDGRLLAFRDRREIAFEHMRGGRSALPASADAALPGARRQTLGQRRRRFDRAQPTIGANWRRDGVDAAAAGQPIERGMPRPLARSRGRLRHRRRADRAPLASGERRRLRMVRATSSVLVQAAHHERGEHDHGSKGDRLMSLKLRGRARAAHVA